MNRPAKATGPLDYDPCEGCPRPCRKACPVKAFDHAAHSSSEPGQSLLPGIDGTYDRVTCNTRLAPDADEAVLAMPKGDGKAQHAIKYCRMCGLSCPAGKRSDEQDAIRRGGY